MTQNTKDAGASIPVELLGVAEVLESGDGFWRSCSGCHETEDGHDVGHYEYSEVLKCTLGGGCSECGGIGAVWDDTDYGAMADAWDAVEIAREQAAEMQPPIYQVMVGDKWVDSTAAEYAAVSNEKRIVYAAIVAPTAEQAEGVRVQYWLVELDRHGNPTLIDGSHSERAGADRAAYLMGALKLSKGRTFSVARIELSDAKPSPVGVNHEAVSQCRHMMTSPASSTGEQA